MRTTASTYRVHASTSTGADLVSPGTIAFHLAVYASSSNDWIPFLLLRIRMDGRSAPAPPVLSTRMGSLGELGCPGPTASRPQLMPISRHMAMSVADAAHPLAPIISVILRPPVALEPDPDGVASAGCNAAPVSAASIRKMRRLCASHLMRWFRRAVNIGKPVDGRNVGFGSRGSEPGIMTGTRDSSTSR
ncbi:hypothetical protein BN2475_380058 [Paraburkholderia ribeironis]|uniref:Uncharacterized protein n=1 Tax=Paraburkholderia ribeironis TaxID=1247936 RepID=A0A1N7S5Q0_9BURK|nr:hypothetical protein BN2475_380058 [Paraburkholderia ribeironis]